MVQAAKNLENSVSPIREAVIFVSRPNIKPLLKQELKAAGIETLHTFDDPDACIEQMVLSSAALLVADTDHDQKVLTSVLQAAQGSFNVGTRPIYLITQSMQPEIISYASEYNISRVHSGEVSRTGIQKDIHVILDEERDEQGIRNTMIRIADSRMRGDWDTSETLLLELYARFPGDARIACELAENYINKEDWEKAGSFIKSIANPGQTNLRLMHMQARCLMHAGAFSDAEALLQHCKLVNPYNVDRLVDLGHALMNMTRVQDALENFELALGMDEEKQEAVNGKIQCKLLSGDVNEALTLMRRITSPRELASLFNNAAILSIRQGRFSNGMQLYKTAIGTIGKNEKAAARLFYNLGIACMKLGNHQEAFSCFEKAANIDTTFQNSKHNANVLAGKLGNKPPYPELKRGNTPYDFSDSVDEENL